MQNTTSSKAKSKSRPNDPCPCGSGLKYKKCCGGNSLKSSLKKVFKPKRSRLIKTPDEIEGMRRAGKYNANLLQSVKPLIRPGVTTEEINTFVHEQTVGDGHIPAPLNYHGFPKSVCTSVNDVVCHGIPTTERILQEGDIINVDVTTIVDGFYGDSSETFYVGEEISADAKKVTETSRHALVLGIEAVRPGATLYDVGDAIQSYVESTGCSVVRDFTGHGIGTIFHDEPQVLHYRHSSSKRFVFEPGMTFTIEPMVNLGHYGTRVFESDKWTAVTIDGSLSAQFEHTLLVTEEGVEILTQAD